MIPSYFYLKGIYLWNVLTDLTHAINVRARNVYDYSCSYIHNKHNTWFFIKGHSLPLPLSHIKNSIHASWAYSNHTLTYLHHPITNTCKLSWLSATITVIDRHKDKEYSYDIDSFLERFRLQTHDQVVPTLTILFLTWCSEMNHWFRPDCIIQFNIIDHNGDEQLLSLGADNDSLEIRNQLLYYRINKHHEHDSSNPYTYYHG